MLILRAKVIDNFDMAKRNLKIHVFHLSTRGWIDSRGVLFNDWCRSDAVRALVSAPYNVFLRISDESMTWEIRKGYDSVRVITEVHK